MSFRSCSKSKPCDAFRDTYDDLLLTKPDFLPFGELYEFMQYDDGGNILTINSDTLLEENTHYENGINIIGDGNSLGRGVTFPCLQTIYYCRVVKSPQEDTMWQHARMFGYDCNPKLMRIFLPVTYISTTSKKINIRYIQLTDILKIFFAIRKK